jgi:hypothetical protein
MDEWTDRRADKWTNGQTERQMDKWSDRQTDRQTEMTI